MMANRHSIGWLAAAVPEDQGGLGFGPQGMDTLLREIGRRAAPGPFVATLVAALWLAKGASDGIKAAYLPAIAAGEISVAIPAAPGKQALRLDGGRLHGTIELLGSLDAALLIIPVADAAGGPGFALIAGGSAGISVTPRDVWDRTRQLCVVACDGVEIAGLIGDPSGEAGRSFSRYLSLAIASDSIGGAAAIAAITIEYMKTRVQFDRPIGSFQALKHRAANMVIQIATQEHLVSLGVETAAAGDPEADMWAALAKAGSTDCFADVAGDSVQLHGGVGHTWDFDCHIFVKRARLNQALGQDNRAERDLAAAALAETARSGRAIGELAL